jgi:hypothetical protein
MARERTAKNGGLGEILGKMEEGAGKTRTRLSIKARTGRQLRRALALIE